MIDAIDADTPWGTFNLSFTVGEPQAAQVVDRTLIERSGDYAIEAVRYYPDLDGHEVAFDVIRYEQGIVRSAAEFLSLEEARTYLYETGLRRFALTGGRYELRNCLGQPYQPQPYQLS